MANEALACFSTVLENVPGWIADLEGVLQRAAERQEDMLVTHQPADTTLVSTSCKAKSKTSSMFSFSRRFKDHDSDSTIALHPQAKHFTNSDALRLSQRKRKTTSACSGELSGPVRSRPRVAAVVFYDGETQKQFEKIVRTVGASRNSIRKGKMSAKVESLSRMGLPSDDSSSGSDTEGDMDDFSPATLRLNFKPTRLRRMPSHKDDTESFDRLDGFLEKAQSSCEHAAHQVLREGDCTPDINNAKQQFLQALKLSEAELPKLRQKAAKAAERERRIEERRRAQEEAEQRRSSLPQAREKLANFIAATVTAHEPRPNIIDLEVDDDSDDGSDSDFNINAMRGKFGAYARMRSTRLTAH